MISSKQTILGFLLGLVAGCGGTSLCAAAIVPWVGDAQRAELGLPMPMKPVIVSAYDVEPLTHITYDDLAQREVPEQIVTASAILPDQSAKLSDQLLTVPLRAGDLMAWSYFAHLAPDAEPQEDDVFDGCLLAIDASASGPKIERSSAEIRARLSKEAP